MRHFNRADKTGRRWMLSLLSAMLLVPLFAACQGPGPDPKANKQPPAKVSPMPSASGSARMVAERECRPGQTEPCVHTDLLTGLTDHSGQGHGFYVAPKQMFVGSNLSLTKLRWRTWGEQIARATGRVTATNCDPSCAEGTTDDHGPVVIEVFHPATSNQNKLYTCARAKRPGKAWGSVDPSLKKVCLS